MTNRITRRQFTAGAVATAAASVGLTRAQAQNFGGDELIEAAKKEGKMVYYTANFTEVEQEVIKAFNKRFPFVRVQLVRAPGGQLITRVRTEAAAGKLAADVVDHSDRGLMLELQDLFQDYAPPNGSDYLPDARVSPKLWPRITSVWVIAYNTELAKNPPKSWKDLTKPEYGPKMIGTVIAPSGGTTWTRVMYERQVLGEDYWKKLAATQPVLFPSGAPLSDGTPCAESDPCAGSGACTAGVCQTTGGPTPLAIRELTLRGTGSLRLQRQADLRICVHAFRRTNYRHYGL